MTYELMFYGGIIGAIIMLPITIYIFIKLNINQVIKDLTGIGFTNTPHTSRRRYQSKTDGKLKKLTSEIKLRKENKNIPSIQGTMETESLHHYVEPTELLEGETSLEETTLLTVEETTLLNETTVLNENPNKFTLEKNIIIVHSLPIILEESEVIEQVY